MTAAPSDDLTPKQNKGIAALLSEPTIRKAADATGITERTMYEWLKIPAFKATFRAAQRDSFKHAISLTQKYLPHAVQTLVQIMADKSAPQSARVAASNSLMKFSRDSLELDDLAERVEKLESASTLDQKHQDSST